MFFKDFKTFETEVAGRKLVIETGKMAQLANGACIVRYGETEVLCTATMAPKPREGVDFFPLSVDFEEKLYAVGRIPGSFGRREGKASEKAVLTSRVIDRPIRPLFPKDMRNDVSVVATVMSVDPDCSPEIAALWGVSTAIAISDIPWDGPVSSVSLGLVDGQYVINPTLEQRGKTEMTVTVASTDSLVAMIEAGANEISNEVMFDGIMFAHEENKKIVEFIKSIVAEIGKEKVTFESNDPSEELYEAIKAFAIDDVKAALDTDDKRIRDERLKPIYDAVHAEFDEKFADEADKIEDCLYKLQKFIVRRWLLDEGKRVDGRGIDEIRPLNAEIDLLSRVHGSGMFTRGRHRFFQSQHLVLHVMRRCLTVLMRMLKRDTSTTTTSPHTQLVKQSPHVAPADVKSVMVHLLKEHFSPLSPQWRNSPTQSVLYQRFFLQTVQHHRVQFVVQHFHF